MMQIDTFTKLISRSGTAVRMVLNTAVGPPVFENDISTHLWEQLFGEALNRIQHLSAPIRHLSQLQANSLQIRCPHVTTFRNSDSVAGTANVQILEAIVSLNLTELFLAPATIQQEENWVLLVSGSSVQTLGLCGWIAASGDLDILLPNLRKVSLKNPRSSFLIIDRVCFIIDSCPNLVTLASDDGWDFLTLESASCNSSPDMNHFAERILAADQAGQLQPPLPANVTYFLENVKDNGGGSSKEGTGSETGPGSEEG